MYDEDVTDPIPCPDAFAQGGDTAAYSQAALLLALGIAAKPEYGRLLETLLESPPFPVPAIPQFRDRVPEPVLTRLLAESRRHAAEISPDGVRRRAAETLYGERRGDDREAVLRLLATSLLAPDELIRVSSAVSALDLVPGSRDAFATLLAGAVFSPSQMVRAIASTALTRSERMLDGTQRLLWRVYQAVWQLAARVRRSLSRSSAAPPAPADQTDACLVHGTLFGHVGTRIEEWWKPGGGDLHDYLRKGARPGIYSGSDYYRWSGGWNDFARDEAVRTLTDWVSRHGFQAIDLFAHSHGANVAMLTSHRVKLRDLILMSCPVHWDIYRPNFGNVRKIVSIRVKWDLVIMADRGDQRFRDPQIAEHVLPIWFSRHDSSRRSSTWRQQKLDELIRVSGVAAPSGAPAQPVAQTPPMRFERFVTVKGPYEVVVQLFNALLELPDVSSTAFQPVVFKNSAPRPQYTLLVSGTDALSTDTIRATARQVGAEIVSMQRPQW